jgi:predicted lipid carrier protein YhbT
VRRLQSALVRWLVRRVGKASRERLDWLMRTPATRRVLLGGIFRAMPRVVRRKALERERAVIEWRITGGRRPDPDVRQLVIENGTATVLPGMPRDPDIAFTTDGVTFLLLATGHADGPASFVRGDLSFEGDPWLAMRLPRIFAAPRAG